MTTALQPFERALPSSAFAHLDNVLDAVRARVGAVVGQSPAAAVLLVAIRATMEAVERTPVKGKDQLFFALRVLRDLVAALPESDARDHIQAALASGGAEAAIELAVAASKGQLDVNRAVEVGASCFAPCKSLFAKCCR